MGVLVEGVWKDQWYDTEGTGGRFVRWESRYRNWVTADDAPGPQGKAASGPRPAAITSMFRTRVPGRIAL